MKTYSKTILTNGLIILLGVLTVPGFAGPKGDSIVDVAIQLNSDGPFAGQFDTLIAAVLAANPIVLETLDGNGKFTVFAPTDDAFAEIGLDPNSVAELDQAFLTDVRIRVLKGGFVYSEGWVLIDNLGREVDLIAFDVKAANGVIHAINRVLLPKAP
ncbi:MAG: fasciclin domain-containing protein [Planctomycetota bacterium]|jgi:uncharacterized surface protein with fasciclin (FAS1) repeats